MIKRIVLLASILIVPFFAYSQQETTTTLPDSTIVSYKPVLADSTLVGVTIYDLLAKDSIGFGEVKINEPAEMERAFLMYKAENDKRKRAGFRIRLYFGNKQSSRVESEMVENEFKELFPTIPVYRSYTNPFFKVVVGDYRTKSQAIRELNNIIASFPTAIVVKENIYYPALDL